MMNDFIGFSFDGIHSSSLNILRVATNDRYQEELFPEINDKSVEVPWMDGQYYFGSHFGTREIEIQIAFDSVTETQFRKIRKLFGTKKTCELIFDERPYKVYQAKVKEPIQLEYVCFDERIKTVAAARDGIRRINRDTETEGWEQVEPYEYSSETQRIYKGEGKIEFICYFPFARQQFKILEQYMQSGNNSNTFTSYDNVSEWAESSGLLTEDKFNEYNIDKVISRGQYVDSYTLTTDTEIDESKTYYEKIDDTYEQVDNPQAEDLEVYYEYSLVYDGPSNYNLQISVYNPGDLNVGFYLFLPFVSGKINPNNGDYIKIYGDENGLIIRPILQQKSDKENGILIDTVHHLIQGVNFQYAMADEVKERFPWQLTGTLYNEYIAAGDFPCIRPSDWYLDNQDYKQAIYLNYKTEQDYENTEKPIIIKYDYLYF